MAEKDVEAILSQLVHEYFPNDAVCALESSRGRRANTLPPLDESDERVLESLLRG